MCSSPGLLCPSNRRIPVSLSNWNFTPTKVDRLRNSKKPTNALFLSFMFPTNSIRCGKKFVMSPGLEIKEMFGRKTLAF